MADVKEQGAWYVYRDGAIRQFGAAVAATGEAKKGGWAFWVPLGENILEYVPSNGKSSRGEPPKVASPGEITGDDAA